MSECFYCGVPLDGRRVQTGPNRYEFAWPTIDHLVPRAAGGTDDPDNLVPACTRCNYAKGTSSVDEFDARDLMTVTEWRRTVGCPTCGAKSGENCLSKRGDPYRWSGSLHKERRP